VIEVGSEKLQIIDSPGHSPGGIMLASFENKLIFTGDTIFRGNIGRTDLPGSNSNTLMESIKKIMSDPRITDDFAIFPGHGGNSNIGREKNTNMFRDNFL
jgi:glyoxylase-like metal-dependent hydrolase (beta-lactamase superfamily II)